MLNSIEDRALRSDRSGDGDWPQKLPHDGPEPTPFQVEGYSDAENVTVEIIDVTGLSVRMPDRSLRMMQDLLGATDPTLVTGNLVEELPEIPEGYAEMMQGELSKRRALRSNSEVLSIPLPPGWEVRISPSGRPYYVDHNTQTT